MTETLNLRARDDGLLLSVRVSPRSGRTSIDGVVDGALRVRVAAAPVDGAANRELCDYLAKHLGLGRRDVELVTGERGRNKVLLLRGISKDALLGRLGIDGKP